MNKKIRIKVPKGGVVDYSRINAVYQGASTKTRMGTKGLGTRGPNGNKSQIPILRSRARHALANNPYAVTAQRTYVDNVIGTGIKPQWQLPELQSLWDRWAKKCDADGTFDFYGLESLIANAEFSDGEVIIRQRWRKPEDNLPVPFQIEVMEGDHLPEGMDNQSLNIYSGIQKDLIGKRTNYYLHPHHPKDEISIITNEPKPVPADEVIHVFNKLRPKQDRGFPHLSVILVRLYEIDEIQDATLGKQKTAALFGAFITRNDEDDFDPDSIGTDDETIVGDDLGEDEEGAQLSEIRGGALHYLEPGESVSFSSPEGIGANYIEWLKTELRASAKAVGLTYEQLTGDLTGVNFSSLRAGLNEFRKRIERVQYHIFIYQLCNRVAEWFLDAVFLNRLVDLPNYLKDPQQYLPSWQTPKLYSVNPLQDAMTDLIENRAGYKTRAQCQMERANPPQETDKKLMEEQGVERAEDLILDSNPSAVNKAGSVQQAIELIEATKD